MFLPFLTFLKIIIPYESYLAVFTVSYAMYTYKPYQLKSINA